MNSIVFTGGGTGGHIYPGLAVAKRLKSEYECRLIWIGSKSALDKKIVEDAGLEFHGIASGKLRRYFSLRNVLDVFNIIAGFFSALVFLKKIRPALVFSKGGFVSVPPCAAASLLGIPVFTHESDFSPGLATRLNVRFASKIFCAYEDTLAQLPARYHKFCIVSGNPVRDEFRLADAERGRAFLSVPRDEKILLVLGGSLGAKQVNELVIQSLEALCKHFTVVHQTGTRFKVPVDVNKKYKAFPYIGSELPDILAAADLVMGRSGAGTVWEAAVASKPMLLVPLSGSATRGDQVENAEYFRRAGAAELLLGSDVQPEVLLLRIQTMLENPEIMKNMAEAAGKIGKKDASGIIVKAILKSIQGAA